jgi:predicted PurR-regulated permease PerM
VKVNEIKFPFYARITIYILGLFGFIAIIYIASDLLIPLVFAFIIAIVLSPVLNFLVRHKVNRVIAIVLVLILLISLFLAFGTLLFAQGIRFIEFWPVLIIKLTDMLGDMVNWSANYFNIDSEKIYFWLENTKSNLVRSNSGEIGQMLMSVGHFIFIFFLIPVYIFLILLYKPLLLDFVHQLSGTQNTERVGQIILQTKIVIQQYLIGLVIEFFIVAALYTITLFALGIEYALLLGVVGALLNLIPYIGGVVGVAIPMIVALVTKSTAWYAMYILIIFYVIQLIDNNYIVPKIVASKVKLNAFISIVAVLVGNAIWGISGMFLSIPLLAILKLILDKIEPLKPWGFLLGDTMPPIIKAIPIFKKRTNKK